ncbi:MAG: sodium:proton antiporter [Lachnospiraceae bacterium]|jgi:multicomponent Na+:H+ antiporter subunit F|nr:sodium:proton antiporter [Lachnospiraceae bacterium]
MIETAYQILYEVSLIALGIGIFMAMIRAIKGPRIADRVVAINMIGTMTMLSIAILALALDQSYLLDVCLIYVMISFLAVVVLCKIYITVYLDKKEKQEANAKQKEEEIC